MYHLKIIAEATNKALISRENSINNQEVFWVVDLDRDAEPIVISEFYTNSKFIVMNWYGYLRAYDVVQKKKIFEINFNTSLNANATLSSNKKKAYISYTKEDHRSSTLTVMNLDDFTVEVSHTLPEPIGFDCVSVRNDGKLLYYYKEEADDKELREHGFQVIDPVSGDSNKTVLPSPSRDDFEEATIQINTKKNIGAITNWDSIPVLYETDGSPRFLTSINIFDLNNFSIIKTLAVREYKVSHLTCYESSDQEIANSLISGENSDDYDKAICETQENLNSIYFCENEDSLWLCWRAGVLRKIALDGSWKSPLLVAVKSTNGSCTEPFGLRTTHTHFLSEGNKHIIVKEHSEKIFISLEGINLKSSQEFIPIDLMPLPNEIEVEAQVPEHLDSTLNEMSFIVIQVENLLEKSSILNALTNILTLSKDIDEIRRGHELPFLIKDKFGNFWEDEKFFHEAIKINKAAEIINEIVQNFINYKDASELYISDEETALGYAVYELSLSSPKYIDTALSYLSIIDFEHDVLCREKLIPQLMEKYGQSEHCPALYLAMAMIDDWEAPDHYLFPTFKDKQSKFRIWFDNSNKKSVKQILKRLTSLGLKINIQPDDLDEGLEELFDAIF